ncbi:cysteine-rich receptor-like protein kinase 25 [Anaeramoeba flamelloides]|uniref:Cysteine-rich receptor-like protein kinase 25 n=1 Tax=Anaeramoeba flamelloides TaxID=1746091 RepID=A0ABQ8YAX7_9EUKA|nr:cysteine-rich receptor-like protein kinase 25 [Anaeramoeba flamelloides]
MNNQKKTCLIFLIFLIFAKYSFAGKCTDYSSKSDCITGDDQCNCVWFQCKAGDTLDKDNAWCLEGDSNGVKDSIKDKYQCPFPDDSANITYKCQQKLSSTTIAIIIVEIVVFVILIIVIIYSIRRKKKESSYENL